MIRQLGLDSKSRPVVSPSVPHSELVEDKTPLPDRQQTMYRAIVARGNYLCQDRSDIRFAVKELSRHMSAPRVQDWAKLKKLGKYLVSGANR